MSRETEMKTIRFDTHPGLLEMTDAGMMWQGKKPSDMVTVAASANQQINDWAAYMSRPELFEDLDMIITMGSKLPRDVAIALFPDLAGRYKYRT
jgi:hypothetical protein